MIPHEERRTVKWFLLFFYIVLLGYDFFYYYLFPVFIVHRDISYSSEYLYLTYIVIILLIPVAFFLNKIYKPTLIKYVYFISYSLTSFIVDISTYYGKDSYYYSGNIVEVFLILTLPLFLNSKYFWLVSLGIITKYIFTGIILNTSYVITPIILILILSILSFFLLARFQGYVQAVSNAYDNKLQGIVKGIIATLELKDPYTRGHSERVANYALLLAQKIGKLSKEEEKSFFYSCLLHDVGKIHIPDAILMKSGRLTNEEYEIIKSHSVVGADAVKNVEGISEFICVIRSHHERWDGKGYPDQLKGEDIPLLARVTAIADAFDAMTSSRSYRAALPVEEAYKRIIEGSGSQFDPMLVEEFKKVFPTWVNYHNKYQWTKK